MSKPKLARAAVSNGPSTQTQPSDVLVSQGRPLVFISHDSRDAELAAAFGNLLTDASGGTLKSFRSSDRKGTAGIEFGAEWYKAIMDSLASATDVVALLTQNSVNRPWILYEVGVAKGKLNSTAFGVALGVPLEKASTGPFAQFQNSADDEDSLTKLVLQLIKRNPEAAPREEAVRRQVQAFRENLDGLTKQAQKSTQPAAGRVDETAVAKLFEEVKILFRDLPEQVEGKLKHARRMGGRRGRRFHPRMLEEVLFRLAGETPDAEAAGWLIFISLMRDDAPWMYEAGLDVYRALQSASNVELAAAKKRFIILTEMLRHHRDLMHEFSDGDEESFMFMRHLPEMADHFLTRVEARRLEALAEETQKRKFKAPPPPAAAKQANTGDGK